MDAAQFAAIRERFPGVTIMFDTIPRWFSKLMVRGLKKTKHYRVPPMPWGIGLSDIEPTLRAWSPRVRSVHSAPFGATGGIGGVILWFVNHVAHNGAPTITRVET